jgi:hypothetical protein
MFFPVIAREGGARVSGESSEAAREQGVGGWRELVGAEAAAPVAKKRKGATHPEHTPTSPPPSPREGRGCWGDFRNEGKDEVFRN